jgi:hypothetical protein
MTNVATDRPLVDDLVESMHAVGLAVTASAAWPERADDTAPPALPGFILSSFSPLVAEVAERCLGRAAGQPPLPAARGDRTALVLVSPLGDVAAAVHVAHTIDRGARVGPLLFFQSVPNSVAGHVATRWGLAGPVVCLASPGAGADTAELLIADDEADEALVIIAEQSYMDTVADRAAAVLVRRDASKGVNL